MEDEMEHWLQMVIATLFRREHNMFKILDFRLNLFL